MSSLPLTPEVDALFKACLRPNGVTKVLELLHRYPDTVHKHDLDGTTPIMITAQNGTLEMAIVLIEHGANINEQSRSRQAAIHYAAKNKDPAILRYLVDSGISADTLDGWENTPIVYAISNYSLASVRYLCEEAKCKTDISNFGGGHLGSLVAWAVYWKEMALASGGDEAKAQDILDYLERFLGKSA